MLVIQKGIEAPLSANGEPQLAVHDALGHHQAGGLNPLLVLIDAGLGSTGGQSQQVSASRLPTE